MSRDLRLGYSVPNLLTPATALSASPASGMAKALVTPADGGIQFIDALGAVVTPAQSGGSALTALTVRDTANTDPSTVLTLNHLLTSGTAGVGIGAQMLMRSTVASGSTKSGAGLTMSFTDVTAPSEDSILTTALCVGGALTDSIVLSAPTAGTNVFTAAGATNANLALRAAGTGIASLQGSGGANIVAADTTGGVSRVGFFGVTPLIRQTVADCVVAADGTSAGTQLNALLARLRLFGLLT